MSNPLHKVGQLIVACETYIVHKNAVLMHKRPDTASKFPGYWLGPGGHVDAGEDVLSAAIREIKEETGVTVQTTDIQLKVLAFHHHLDRKEVWMEYLFRAEIAKDQEIYTTEDGENKWIPIPELVNMENIFPPAKYYLEHILNPSSGIMYNASEWENASLVRVTSEHVDKNS